MATRLYFMPAITEIRNDDLTKHPKYDSLWEGRSFQVMDFGAEPWFLCAVDADDIMHGSIVANADVLAFPVTLLDSAVTDVWKAAVNTRLEAAFIPVDWILATMTHREVLRVFVHMFQVLQALQGARGDNSAFFTSQTLDTRYNQLDVTLRNELTAAAQQLKLDTTGIRQTSTLRAIMKILADQWQGGPIQLLDIVL